MAAWQKMRPPRQLLNCLGPLKVVEFSVLGRVFHAYVYSYRYTYVYVHVYVYNFCVYVHVYVNVYAFLYA